MLRTFTLLACSLALLPAQQKKYDGPRPPKPDVLYLLHASNLVETEMATAKEDKKKDDLIYSVDGAASPARTPLAEPIFLLDSKKLLPDRLQLYKFDVKNGKRELVIKRKKDSRPMHLSMKRLGEGIYRIEANEFLPNGEYGLSPEGSNDVFCFQVY